MNKDLILAGLLATALHAGAFVSLGFSLNGPAVFNADETGVDMVIVDLAPTPVEPETAGEPMPDDEPVEVEPVRWPRLTLTSVLTLSRAPRPRRP